MHCQKVLLKFIVCLPIILEYISSQHGSSAIRDPSICTKYESYMRSRYVSYIETYKKGWGIFKKIATRINYRWQSFQDLRIVEECCHGYRRENSASVCKPICPGGCDNGECYRPNLCKCFTGYAAAMNLTDGYLQCSPQCIDGCNGGRCTAPNVCTCYDGYLLGKDLRTCEPVCTVQGADGTQGCGDHASCVAPETCECHRDYRRILENARQICVPQCTPPCGSNSICAAPNKCLCAGGYVVDSNTLAESDPSSMSNDSEMTTEPPSTDTTTRPSEMPSVNCKPLCVPDCGANSTCSAPNVCECDPGYNAETLMNGSTHSLLCAPICDPPCTNALCAYPYTCSCHSGYQPDPYVATACEPICQEECINASCTQPDHCECYEGYVKMVNNTERHNDTSENVCIPSCPSGCLNGQCVAPGECVCDDGYGYVLLVRENPWNISITNDLSFVTNELTSYYSTASTNDYGDTDSTNSYSSDGANYHGTDSTSTSSFSSTIDPTPEQSCQPVCEPRCSNASICIAPNQCQIQSKNDQDSTNRIMNHTDCNGNDTDHGVECNTIESAFFAATAVSAIGTVLLVIISGLGLVVYLACRRKKIRGRTKSMVAMMDQSEASDPLFTADEVSSL